MIINDITYISYSEAKTGNWNKRTSYLDQCDLLLAQAERKVKECESDRDKAFELLQELAI